MPRDLSSAVPMVRTYRQSTVPAILTPEEVERVLATADAWTARGRRDAAILLLLARLGLRASEIVFLELDDIRWRAGEIVLRANGEIHVRPSGPAKGSRSCTVCVARDRLVGIRSFLRLSLDEAPPDHSTISRTGRFIDVETHRAVFTWVQQRLVETGLLKGKTVAIETSTLEANADMRSIVRRDLEDSYQEFLAQLAKACGIETPPRDDFTRLDRERQKRTSKKEWMNPYDPDAKMIKMKDGRTLLAHKAEHAPEPQRLEEIVADEGYHSNQTMVAFEAVGIRSYVAAPDRRRRDWSEAPQAQAPVYGNRRIRERRGRRLMRRRRETIERSFAHLYDTGGMRSSHLRGHANILRRLLIHAGGFSNLGLVMRHLLGVGTARGLQGRVTALIAPLLLLIGAIRRRVAAILASYRVIPAIGHHGTSPMTFSVDSVTTGLLPRAVAFFW